MSSATSLPRPDPLQAAVYREHLGLPANRFAMRSPRYVDALESPQATRQAASAQQGVLCVFWNVAELAAPLPLVLEGHLPFIPRAKSAQSPSLPDQSVHVPLLRR
jgi:hypothetical protein